MAILLAMLVALALSTSNASASMTTVNVTTNTNTSQSSSSFVHDVISVTVNGVNKTIDTIKTGLADNSKLSINASSVNGKTSITVNGVDETNQATASASTNTKTIGNHASTATTEPLLNPVVGFLKTLSSDITNALKSFFSFKFF